VTSAPDRDRDRLLRALQQLLALEVSDLEHALSAAAQQIADATRADKVDVFLHEPATAMLVAVGTNDSPMVRKQRALGLDRLPIASRDGAVSVDISTGTRSRFAASWTTLGSAPRSACRSTCAGSGTVS
jgi:hypothetical protein